jgi:hypothetical protein
MGSPILAEAAERLICVVPQTLHRLIPDLSPPLRFVKTSLQLHPGPLPGVIDPSIPHGRTVNNGHPIFPHTLL